MSDQGMTFSSRNQLVGQITDVASDGILSRVELQVGADRIVAVISSEAVAELELKVGDQAVALVKSTSVSIALKDE